MSTDAQHGRPAVDDIFAGAGEARAVARGVSWSATPLGAISTWPHALRAACRLMLASPAAMAVWAGPALQFIPNDACASLLGGDVLRGLGLPGHEVGGADWAFLGSAVAEVLRTGGAVRRHDLCAPEAQAQRPGARFHASLSPVEDEAGAVVGVLGVLEALPARAPADAEAWYRSLFDSIDEGFCIVEMLPGDEATTDYRFLEVNRAFERLTGIAGAVGRRVRELAPGLETQWFEIFGKIAVSGEPLRFEQRAEPLGRTYDAFAFRVGAPEDRRVAMLFTDVTGRRQAEEAVRLSEEKLRLLADTMSQIVCVLGPDGAVEYVNRGWEEYSGLDAARTREVGWGHILHPDDLLAARACRRAVLETRSPQTVEARYRAADGTYRWFLSNLAPVVEGARVVKLVGAAMDIEARKRAELALRDQLALQDQLAKVAASVPGVVCTFRLAPDGSTSMPFSAPAIEDLYGVPAETLARDMAPAFARTEPDDLARVRETIAASAASLSPWHEVFRYLHPTKGLRWIEASSIPAREPDGATVWHGYVADVTDQRAAEQALQQANDRLREADKRKDEFLGMLSHELRNPLAPIRSALFLLDHTPPGSPQARRAKEILDRQVLQLTHLVDDLLDVTRIVRGKIRLQRAPLDLVALARRSVDDRRTLFADRGVVLTFAGPERPVAIHGDETRLAQVLGNILHNALKFTPSGGQVSVAVAVEEGAARVRIRDTGAGIDPAFLGAVFEPFTQGEQTLARTEGGLGLGLALVKALVELHGGEVRAVSEGRGHGAEIALTLPLLVEDAREGERPAAGADTPPRRRRVLVVDDNHDAADSLAQLVRILGHDVEVAYEGPTALAKARAHPPDVMLCDLGLPGMDGYAIARSVRRDGPPGVRLVAVTGYARPEDVALASEAGFEGHVAKPPNPELIRSVLR